MSKLPKLEEVQISKNCYGIVVLTGELRRYLKKSEASEVIRIVEAHDDLLKLLRYFFNLPASGARNQSEHCKRLQEAKLALEKK